jgi:hypothetical protein
MQPYVLVPLMVFMLVVAPATLLCGGLVASRRQEDDEPLAVVVTATIVLWALMLLVMIGLQMYGYSLHPKWWDENNGGMAAANFIEVFATIGCAIPLAIVVLDELD